MLKKILFAVYTIIVFLFGVEYVAYDVYRASQKVEGTAQDYYKAIWISKYIKFLFDDYALDAMFTLEGGLKTLSKKERFDLYRELILNCDDLCGKTAYLGESVHELFEKEKKDLVRYLKSYLKENQDISSEDKKKISDWINTLSYFDDEGNKVVADSPTASSARSPAP